MRDHFFNQRFGETAPNLLNAMKEGSAYVDRFPGNQGLGGAPEHATTPLFGDQGEAFKAMCAFVKDQMDQFRGNLNNGELQKAYHHLGQAMHTVQDSTSPLHSGMQTWPGKNAHHHGNDRGSGFIGSNLPSSYEGMNALTPQLEIQTLNLMGAVASGDYSVMKHGKKDCGQF